MSEPRLSEDSSSSHCQDANGATTLVHRSKTTGHDLDALEPSSDVQEKWTKERFSLDKSTAEFWEDKNEEEVGAYGHIRSLLDYTYHQHYSRERQWLHDAIIAASLLEHQHDYWSSEEMDTRLPETPWFLFLVGVHGAGKHHVIRELMAAKKLCLLSFVCIDTDDIRRYLPEYSTYLSDCPDKADALTRKECGYLCETLALATLKADRNVIFHCNPKDVDWYKSSYIPFLRRQCPAGLKVGLIHITCDLEVALGRVRSRGKLTGRTISEDEIVEQLEVTIPWSVDILTPVVDFSCTIQNNKEPVLLDDDKDWQQFKETFTQQSKLELSAPPSKPPPPGRLPGKPQSKSRRSSTTGLRENYSSFGGGYQSPQLRRRSSLMLRRFSTLQSSEENHKADQKIFVGQFAHIRSTLDYTYHRPYTIMRQNLQDGIIRHFLDTAFLKNQNGEVCTTPTEPWVVYTAGAMGAGKGHTMKRLVKEGRFPLLAFVRVDPDAIRQYLPEFHLYIQQSPELAGELTMKEAGYIAEILELAGLEAGKNVLVDGSLRRASWYREHFARLRRDFKHLRLRIAIIHVTAPREAVFRRAAERAIHTGRIVPPSLLAETLDEVPKSVRELAPLVDYHVDLLNAPNAPDIEILTPGVTWESFTANWIQTCAWVPRSQKRLLKKSLHIERELLEALES